MLPTIQPGGKVTVLPLVKCGKCNPNDIVVFENNRGIVCHRLLFFFNTGKCRLIYEKGDNNFLGRFINENRIIGKVIAIDGNNDIPDAPVQLSPVRLFRRRCTDHICRLVRERKK